MFEARSADHLDRFGVNTTPGTRIGHIARRVSSIVRAGLSPKTKWVFGNPPRAPVVVVDGTTTERLERTILDGLPVLALDTRFGTEPSRVYLSPAIVARLVTHFASGTSLFASYVLACLERIGPKVVVDNIHCPWLVDVAIRYPTAQFLVIMNAPRPRIIDRELTQMSTMYQDELAARKIAGLRNFHIFCFGQKDVEIFAEAGVGEASTGIRYYAVGSMCADRYRSDVGGNVHRNVDDVCFISQVASESVNSTGLVERMLVRVTDVVLEHLVRYVGERGLSCTIQLRSWASEEAAEREYYRSRLPANSRVRLSSRVDTFSAYAAVADARVIVTLYSSLGVEAAGWGKRAMFCPLEFTRLYRFAPARFRSDAQMWPWLVETAGYTEFRATLDRLSGLSDEAYETEMMGTARYFANCGSTEPAHVAIRRQIENVLASTTAAIA